MFPSGRRFNSYADWCRNTFGTRLQKLSIDAGFTCPNRDGTLDTRGCSFCNNDGFNPSYCDPQKSIRQQIEEGILFHKRRYRRAARYIAYFQAYSNTYAPLQRLKDLYSEALSHPDISGISIGTRPDCVNEAILDYLASLSENYFVTLELGLESCSDETLRRVNRGHDFSCTQRALRMAEERGIRTGAHFIMGLPGESEDYLLEQVDLINRLPLHSIKFHQLQLLKGSSMEEAYHQDPSSFKLFGLDEYIDLMVRILERLRPDLLVERLSGEVPPRFLVVQAWELIRNDEVIRRIEKRLEECGTFQGKRYILT